MGRDPSDKRVPAAENTSARPLLIGWKEFLDFPEWGIRRVKVKIDTGARTSALDVAGFEMDESDGQAPTVLLQLALNHRHPEQLTVVRASVLRVVAVKNTSGIPEARPVIEALIRLGPVVKRIPVTLTNRSDMLFRMILGRKALQNDFVVDVSKKYLLRGK